jgi:lipoyl(octanoyl) transferase
MDIEIKKSLKPVNYESSIRFLEERLSKIENNEAKELIWVLEHEEVFTAGTSYAENEIIDKSINIIKTNRGGKITLHNPGQIIIYLVINLNNRKKDIRRLISSIEKSVIEFLKIFKIYAKKDKKNIGIWVNGNKIAAIGLRVSKWVAFHGFSINISNNLMEYQKIMPCGLDNTKITSVYSEKKIVPKNYEKKLINILIKNINKI